MTIFYHVSTDIFHDGVFTPRIPYYRHKDHEDASIERVCVSDSIENCLTAIPGGGSNLDILNIEQRGYFLVFRIDTEKLGITDKDIITNQELFEKDLVRDAEATNEVWITTPFVVPESDRFLIKLITWEEEAFDLYPYAIQQLAYQEYEGDFEKAYQEVYKDFVPFCTKIVCAKYVHESVKKGSIVPFYFESELEMEELKTDLLKRDDIEIVKEFMDEIEILCKKDMNLRDIFIQHAIISRDYL